MHDSRTFVSLYNKIKDIGIKTLVADAGYKTPAIAKLLIDDGIQPLLPYKRPMTKKYSSRNMSMFMMNTTIVKYVRIIRFLNIQQLTVMDTESTKVVQKLVLVVHI